MASVSDPLSFRHSWPPVAATLRRPASIARNLSLRLWTMSDLLYLSGRRVERQMAESPIVVLRTPYSFPYSRACNPRLDWLDLEMKGY